MRKVKWTPKKRKEAGERMRLMWANKREAILKRKEAPEVKMVPEVDTAVPSTMSIGEATFYVGGALQALHDYHVNGTAQKQTGPIAELIKAQYFVTLEIERLKGM